MNLIVLALSERLTKFCGIEINDANKYEATESFTSNYPCDVFRGLHSIMYIQIL